MSLVGLGNTRISTDYAQKSSWALLGTYDLNPTGVALPAVCTSEHRQATIKDPAAAELQFGLGRGEPRHSFDLDCWA
jgi:hypothetical protein